MIGERRRPGIDFPGLLRLIETHNLIKERYYPNCNTLADRFEVHRRTAERDIERLRDLFKAPLEYDPYRRGYYYTSDFTLPQVWLSEGEAVALYLGQKLLMQCRGTPFEEDIHWALAKIRALLPARVQVDLERVGQVISFHVDPLRGDESQVATWYRQLAAAIEQRRTVEMTYYSASRDAVTRRRVDPYHLHFADGAWYVIGHCAERQAFRTFALFRILSLRVTDQEFLIKSDFSIDDYLANAFFLERGEPQEVVIRFDPYQARYIRERQWHPTQRLEEHPDGSITLSLRVGGLGEVQRWVMSFGSHAEVLAPASLRQAVISELRSAMESYRE